MGTIEWLTVAYVIASFGCAGVLCWGIERLAKKKEVDWTNENRGPQRW
jgi:hypothetical protein